MSVSSPQPGMESMIKETNSVSSPLQESLLEVLSEHIDTLADSSHYFVVDPSDTSIMSVSMNGVRTESYTMAFEARPLTQSFLVYVYVWQHISVGHAGQCLNYPSLLMQFHKRSIVFSDMREKSEGCVNKFSLR